jgi:hypothetical protein
LRWLRTSGRPFTNTLPRIALMEYHELQDARYSELVAYLTRQFEISALGRLMDAEAHIDEDSVQALGRILGAYSDFIELMLGKTTRKQLEENPYAAGRAAPLRDRIERDGVIIQDKWNDGPTTCKQRSRATSFSLRGMSTCFRMK